MMSGHPVFIVDGSNMAHTEGGSKDPSLHTALAVKQRIIEVFSVPAADVELLFDSSFFKRIPDAERSLLKELRSRKEVQLCPARTSADGYLLDIARQKHAVLVSADLFRDRAALRIGIPLLKPAVIAGIVSIVDEFHIYPDESAPPMVMTLEEICRRDIVGTPAPAVVQQAAEPPLFDGPPSDQPQDVATEASNGAHIQPPVHPDEKSLLARCTAAVVENGGCLALDRIPYACQQKMPDFMVRLAAVEGGSRTGRLRRWLEHHPDLFHLQRTAGTNRLEVLALAPPSVMNGDGPAPALAPADVMAQVLLEYDGRLHLSQLMEKCCEKQPDFREQVAASTSGPQKGSFRRLLASLTDRFEVQPLGTSHFMVILREDAPTPAPAPAAPHLPRVEAEGEQAPAERTALGLSAATPLAPMTATPEPQDLPGQALLDEKLLSSAVEEINRIYVTGGLKTALSIGRAVVRTFFGGDLTNFTRLYRRHMTFRALAAHPDIQVSFNAIWYSVSVLRQFDALPQALAQALPYTHHKLLLPVQDEALKVRLAQMAIKERMSTRDFAVAVRQAVGQPAATGRRALPGFVKGLRKLTQAIDLATAEPVNERAFDNFSVEQTADLLKEVDLRLARLENLRAQIAAHMDDKQHQDGLEAPADDVGLTNYGTVVDEE